MRPLVTSDEMRAAEQAFVNSGGDLDWLMRQAGMQVASRVPSGKAVLVLAGPGNNGGDAVIAASIIAQRGDTARLYFYRRAHDKQPSSELPVARFEDDGDLSLLKRELSRADIVVDGLLGIGRKRPVDGDLAGIIAVVNTADVQRIAIDLPTGVDADTGAVDRHAFRAEATVALGFGKRGLWGTTGADYAGAIQIADVGLPPGIGVGSTTGLLDEDDIRSLLPLRSRDWNKGKSGRVLAVTGSRDFSGAPCLVALAAYRAGAGLVDLAVPLDARQPAAVGVPEAVFTAVPDSANFSDASVAVICETADKAQAIAIGPGLGSAPSTVRFVRSLLPRLQELDHPTVMDADALNAVAELPNWWSNAPRRLVITPHPGEMGRLLGMRTEEVQHDRFGAAERAANTWDTVVVLKGSNTIIAAPARKQLICPLGGPNLGTGGTGDVLTGIIAAYLAQGLDPIDAATAGVWVHAASGDAVRSRLGQTGTVASDLWREIPLTRKRLLDAANLD